MVYISLRKIPSAADDEKVKRWQVLQPDGNEEYIGAILSRKNALSRQNSIEAHTLLDEMLLSLTSIKKAVLCRDENGKPYIENEKISFNLTHTSEAVACAIDTEGNSIGIDAEIIGRDGKNIIDRFFDEIAKHEYETADNRALEFARIWTEKEAFSKFLGAGITDYSTSYPAPHKFTHLISDSIFITVCSSPGTDVLIWQNDEYGRHV